MTVTLSEIAEHHDKQAELCRQKSVVYAQAGNDFWASEWEERRQWHEAAAASLRLALGP